MGRRSKHSAARKDSLVAARTAKQSRTLPADRLDGTSSPPPAVATPRRRPGSPATPPPPSPQAGPSPSNAASPQPSTSTTKPSLPSSRDSKLLASNKVPPPTSTYSAKFVISQEQLEALIAPFSCSNRKCSKKLNVIASGNCFDATFDVVCTDCARTYSHAPPKIICKTNKLTEVNVQEVYHSLISGIGKAGMSRKSGFVGSDEMSAFAYSKHCQFLFQEMESYYNTTMKAGHETITEYYTANNISVPDDNNNLDIEVSFDGTWMTRGHRSHIGVGFVIEVYTGLIVDYQVAPPDTFAFERLIPCKGGTRCQINV